VIARDLVWRGAALPVGRSSGRQPPKAFGVRQAAPENGLVTWYLAQMLNITNRDRPSAHLITHGLVLLAVRAWATQW
jgi:hypothetical protein